MATPITTQATPITETAKASETVVETSATVENNSETVPESETAKQVVLADDLGKALKPRLDAAKATGKSELLKLLGLSSEEEAKAVAAELAARREAAKTAEQKHAEALAQAETARKRAEELESSIKVIADGQLSKLTTEQREAVEAIAGDDPSKVVKTIAALSKTWAVQAAPKAVETPAPAPKAVPARDTAPKPAAPPPGGTEPPPDVREVVAEVRKTNPFKAARIVSQNMGAFLRPQR